MNSTQDTRFVILTTQRSGSTWLVDVLNNLSNVATYGELFLPETRLWDAGALDYPRFRESAQFLEADHFLVKPVSPDEVLAAIKTVLPK